jgi:hypothetical protein
VAWCHQVCALVELDAASGVGNFSNKHYQADVFCRLSQIKSIQVCGDEERRGAAPVDC